MSAGNCASPGEIVPAPFPARSRPRRRRPPARLRPAGSGRANLRGRRSPGGAGDRQPRLGLALRKSRWSPRPATSGRRETSPRIRICSTIWQRGSSRRLVAEVAPPGDHAVSDVPAVEPPAQGCRAGRPGECPSLADEPAATGHRSRIATRCCARAGLLDETMDGPSGDLDSETFYRRTVYGRVSRSRPSKLLAVYDFPRRPANRPGARPDNDDRCSSCSS